MFFEGELFEAVNERARKLDEFEMFLIDLHKSAGGVITQQTTLLKLIIDYSEYLGLGMNVYGNCYDLS